MTTIPPESFRSSLTPEIMSYSKTNDFTRYETELHELNRDKLAAAAEHYARYVQDSYTESQIVDVELDRIEWKVSSQLCRSGAYCETQLDDPPNHTIVLSYPGYRAWGWDRMAGVIRHELAHVVVNEQFAAETRPHGPEFCDVAESLDAPLRGEEPIPYRYKLFCSRCGSMTAGLYQASDRTRDPWNYKSSCCQAPLQVEAGEGWR